MFTGDVLLPRGFGSLVCLQLQFSIWEINFPRIYLAGLQLLSLVAGSGEVNATVNYRAPSRAFKLQKTLSKREGLEAEAAGMIVIQVEEEEGARW